VATGVANAVARLRTVRRRQGHVLNRLGNRFESKRQLCARMAKTKNNICADRYAARCMFGVTQLVRHRVPTTIAHPLCTAVPHCADPRPPRCPHTQNFLLVWQAKTRTEGPRLSCSMFCCVFRLSARVLDRQRQKSEVRDTFFNYTCR